MKYATLCSGIEAPSVAWPDWEPVFFSVIAWIGKRIEMVNEVP